MSDPTLGLEASEISPVRNLSGTQLGDYLVLEAIGSGGGGQVYRAQHRHMGRDVAIKVLSQSASSNPSLARRFRREVRASAQLLHPNIVTAFDAGEFQDMLYLVMEYVDGESLFQLVRRNGPLSLGLAADYLLQAARGLAYAHDQGVIHRDIKPSNLMVNKAGHVKILDLGLARLNSIASHDTHDSISAELTTHGTVIGTLGYISPEQISNARTVDLRTDIYSLGCTYHFLVTGRPPYSGALMETLIAHAKGPIPSLREARKDVPVSLDAAYQRMMAKEASDRFASMEEVQTALAPFAGESINTMRALEGVADEIKPDSPISPLKQKARESSTISAKKAVGFDIGTHTAYASWISEEGLPTPILNQQQSLATPSVVKFQDGGLKVGQQALESISDAGNIADRFVCRLGRGDARRVLSGKELPYEVLAAVIARQLAADAQQRIGYFSRAVYTVPGCFGDVQRKAYQDAYHIAYLDTLKPINASAAVAVHFSFLHGWLNPGRVAADPRTLLVLRFGGGSFDATVFGIVDRQIRTLAIAGDSSIGGAVWDDRIVQCVADQLKARHGIGLENDPARMLLLRRHCESGKVALSHQDQLPFRVQIKGKTLEGVLSRSFLNRLGADLLDRAESLTREALAAATVTWDDLDHVLLAGGTAQMPVVKQTVEKWAGSRNVTSLIGSDAAPGGAALFAQLQIHGPETNLDFQLHEVASHYFGIRGTDRRTQQKRISVVIPQNTPLPASATRTFRTSKDGQTSLILEIVEGTETGDTSDRPVGTCQIENLPPGMPAGTPIEIELHVSENGMVSVFVESLATGRRSSPTIQRAGVMTADERLRWRDWLDTGSMCGQFA